ncbi:MULTISPECIES: GMC oxidoreductase [Nostoc]|uniref:GMC oxidoreductase n=1 Tax=Nostoc TaxID=1177 RepID=UPI001F54CFDD|nr:MULTISPECIES: GMC oxidoreductase [Nostoc]
MNIPSQTDVQVQRIRAIGLTVMNCDRSLHFYTQALGFKFVSDITVAAEDYNDLEGVTRANIRIITLQLGDELIELMEYLNIPSQPIPSDSQSNDLWFQHLAIVVSDMDSAYTHLRSFPIQPISTAPQTIPPGNEASGGVRAFKFKDPDGHDLELIWFPPGYWVSGNTKLYGAALVRLRERDFEKVIHKGGISPEWPLKYQDFEPYYTQAEKLNDFYWGEPDFPYPMGMVQNTGNVLADMIPAEAPPLMAPFVKLIPHFERHLLAQRSVGWWLQTEDLPDPNNQIRVVGDKIHIDYTLNNTEASDRLIHRWTSVLKSIPRSAKHVLPFSIYPRTHLPEQAVAHQCGSCRFGTDPQTSVLDLNCRTHDVDNLYVVDSSFFPSNSGANPTLTIMANALRVGDHLAKRLR